MAWTRRPSHGPIPRIPIPGGVDVERWSLRSENHGAGAVRGHSYAPELLYGFAWWYGPDRGEPVRVSLGAQHRGPFIAPKISLAYLPTEVFDPAHDYDIDTELLTRLYTWRPARITTGPSGLREVEGETVIGRLQRTFLRAPITIQGPLTASEALNAILAEIQARYPDVTYRPAPPLYLRGATGWYEPTIEWVSIVPDEERPRSLAEVLREWIEPFYGYALGVDPDNVLEIVPPWWAPLRVLTLPPSPATATFHRDPLEARVRVTGGGMECLTAVPMVRGESATASTPCGEVALSLSEDGELAAELTSGDGAVVEVRTAPDYVDLRDTEEARTTTVDTARIVNHAIVRNEGYYEFVADEDILQPSWFRVWGYGWWCWPQWREFTHPTESELGPPSGHDLGLVRMWEHLRGVLACDVDEWVYVGRAPAVDATIVGGEITLTATVSWWGDQCLDTAGPGHLGDRTLTLTFGVGEEGIGRSYAPVPGLEWPSCPRGYLELRAKAVVNDRGLLDGVDLWVRGRFRDERIGGGVLIGDGHWSLGAGVLLSATAARWQKSRNSQIGEWGESPSSQDAETPGLLTSRASYGIRRREITISTYKLAAEDLQAMARMLVERNLAPARVLDVLVTPPYHPGPDALGQRATLADGVGMVEEWRYTETHAPAQNRANTAVRVRIEENLLAQDVDACAWHEMAWGYGRWCR